VFEKPLKELESAKAQKGQALSSLKRRPRGGCTGKKWQSGDLLVKEENRQLEVARENFNDRGSIRRAGISVVRGSRLDRLGGTDARTRRENVVETTCIAWIVVG
jgi:hypothetical protein